MACPLVLLERGTSVHTRPDSHWIWYFPELWLAPSKNTSDNLDSPSYPRFQRDSAGGGISSDVSVWLGAIIRVSTFLPGYRSVVKVLGKRYLISVDAKVTLAPPSPPQKFARASPASIVDLEGFDQGSAEITDRCLPSPPSWLGLSF